MHKINHQLYWHLIIKENSLWILFTSVVAIVVGVAVVAMAGEGTTAGTDICVVCDVIFGI